MRLKGQKVKNTAKAELKPKTKGYKMKKILLSMTAASAITMLNFSALAITDYGNFWDKNNLPSEVWVSSLGVQASTETQIADLLNTVKGTSFTAGEIFKTTNPLEINVVPPYGGQFEVPGGWSYLVVQYDGKNAGNIIIELGGVGALVPYNDYNLWATDPGKRAVSHFSVAGPVSVPDAGFTATLLGLGMLGLSFLARHKA